MPFVGFDGNITETGEAQRMLRGFEIAYRHGLWTPATITPGTGLTLNVSALDGQIAGVYFTTAASTVTLATAPTGTNRRVDYIVAEANWNSTATALGTPANSVAVQRITGTAVAATAFAAAPSLTQNAGDVWQMPLWRVTVAGGATSLATAAIEPCAAQRLKFDRYTLTPNVDTMRGSATNWNSLGSLTVVDPGRSFRLQVSAAVRFDRIATGGYMRIRAIDADTATVYGDGISSSLAAGKTPAFISAQLSGVLTGTRRVRLEMLPVEVAAGEQIQVLDNPINHFTVLPLPA